MSSSLAKKRTRIETADWDQVRELMPRRRGTRGIQYEALEYLYENLYEKVSEEQLREHLLRVKGHLQEKGDPVKSAINLAIKELQRLSKPTFDLIKIQEASLVGKTRRYVQLNFTGFDSVIDFAEFQSYLDDVLSEEELPIIRSIYDNHPNIEPTIFPGLKPQWLQKIHAIALVSSSRQIDDQNPKTVYHIIPESHCNQSFLMLYENEESELPFLAFVTDINSVNVIGDSQYLVYRGEEKIARLEFYHQIWMRQQEIALTVEEAALIRTEAAEARKAYGQIDEKALRKGLIALKVRQKRQALLQKN
ncbi:MAG: hypothetical protein HN945_00370 [Deltaproteobacteria bacterium]|jgi:hypothetical protein|nr:hypothetical protein [Deltaproteobacteria bacterium]MBT4639798.1 hypothetical protein [Deltaproteobacteria bacterium]MBT7150885.1 hypothetical protein [Deltaproteobacteria bacterium]